MHCDLDWDRQSECVKVWLHCMYCCCSDVL